MKHFQVLSYVFRPLTLFHAFFCFRLTPLALAAETAVPPLADSPGVLPRPAPSDRLLPV